MSEEGRRECSPETKLALVSPGQIGSGSGSGFWIGTSDNHRPTLTSGHQPPDPQSTKILKRVCTDTKKIDVDEIKLNETIDLFLVKNN